LASFCVDYGITLSFASNYYPHGKDVAKSSDKNVLKIIKRIVGDNQRSQYSKLKYASWTNIIPRKKWKIHFELVYGMNASLPINLKIPIYNLMK